MAATEAKPDWSRLPGRDLVTEGRSDLECGLVSEAALLVSIGAPPLRRLGLEIEAPLDDPEHRLYDLLARTHGDAAHTRYNGLIRRLVSFERAAECARVADAVRIRAFMETLGRAAEEEATAYLAGGTTAVLVGWREARSTSTSSSFPRRTPSAFALAPEGRVWHQR